MMKKPFRDWDYYKNNAAEDSWNFTKLTLRLIDEKDFTPIEKITAYILRYLFDDYGRKNLQITPQKQIGKYRVDFEIIHRPYFLKPEEPDMHKIVIECDGHDFHEKTKEQAQRDKERDRFLTKEGYTVLRFTGREITTDPLTIIQDIDAVLDPEEYRNLQEFLASLKE